MRRGKICVYKAAVSSTQDDVDESVKLLFPDRVWLARSVISEEDKRLILRMHEDERSSVSYKIWGLITVRPSFHN